MPTFSTGYSGPIGGNLPWAPASTAAIANPTDPGSIASGYLGAYNSALGMNQANYNNILQGYQQTIAGQTTAQQAIQAGYSDLYNSVLGKIQGIGQARANQINMDAAKNLAGSSQQLIDRGLGNSTIQSSVNRGVEADRNQAQLALSDQLSQLYGQYASQLGGSELNYRERALGNQTGEQNRQLDFMNSLQAKYPDAAAYGQLAQNAASLNALRAMPGNRAGGGGGGVFAGPQYGKLGYTGYQEPYYGASGSGGSASAGSMGGGAGGYGNVAGGGIGAYLDSLGGATYAGEAPTKFVDPGYDMGEGPGGEGKGIGFDAYSSPYGDIG